MNIPLTKPYWGKKEEQAVINALRTSSGTGDGPFSRRLVQTIKQLTKSHYVFPVPSATHGLELAMQSLKALGRFRDGDEVIVPSFTMTSTANCVLLAGARPIFADIEPRYFTIDPTDIKRKVTDRTRGIIIVHYAGMPCNIVEIGKIARRHKLFVIEDAAHAIGATYKRKHLGTIFDIGVYSFHGTKNISCGEGGLILTQNSKAARYMEMYRTNGTNRNAFLRGEVDKYSWVLEGSSLLLSDILANIINTQLSQIAKINKLRYQIASYYTKHLLHFEKDRKIQLPQVPSQSSPNWHIYAIRFEAEKAASSFITQMKKKGIAVSRHYVPLHNSTMGVKLGTHRNRLPVTETIAKTLVRLPIYPGLTKKELSYIVSTAAGTLNAQ